MADEDNKFKSFDLSLNISKDKLPIDIKNNDDNNADYANDNIIKRNNINDQDIAALNEDEDGDLKDYDIQLTPPQKNNKKLFSEPLDMNDEKNDDDDIKEVNNEEDDDYLADNDNDELKNKTEAKAKKPELILEQNDKDKDKMNEENEEFEGMISHDEYDSANKNKDDCNDYIQNSKEKDYNMKEKVEEKEIIDPKSNIPLEKISSNNKDYALTNNNSNSSGHLLKNNIYITSSNDNDSKRKTSPNNNSIKHMKSRSSYLKIQQKNYKKKFIYQPSLPYNISQVPLSRFDFAESKYNQLRNEIEKIINTPVTTDSNGYCNCNDQNTLMLQYLSILNTIVGDMTENSRLSISKHNSTNKSDSFQTNHSTSSLKQNNEKILDRYRAELLKFQSRYNQITDAQYETRINQEIIDSKVQIAYFEKENKQLRNNQKVAEIFLEQQNKINPKSQMEIKRIEMDHKNLAHQYELMITKVEQNRQALKNNESRINELKKWKEKMENAAKEECGLLRNKAEIDNCNEVYNEKNKEVNRLLQDNKILDKVYETNKKRFMNELLIKERTVFEKEKKRRELDSILKEKSIQLKKLEEMIQLYQMQQNALQQKPQEIKKENDNINIDNDDMNEMLNQRDDNDNDDEDDNQPRVHISGDNLDNQFNIKHDNANNNNDNNTIEGNITIKQNENGVTSLDVLQINTKEPQVDEYLKLRLKEESNGYQKNIIEKKDGKQYNKELILPLIENPSNKRQFYDKNELHPNQVPFNPIHKTQTNNTLNERKSTLTIHSEHKGTLEYEYEHKPSSRMPNEVTSIDNKNKNQKMIISNQKVEKITHELDNYGILHLATKKGNDLPDNDILPHKKNDYPKKITIDDNNNENKIPLQELPSPLNNPKINIQRNNNQRKTIEEEAQLLENDNMIVIQENCLNAEKRMIS